MADDLEHIVMRSPLTLCLLDEDMDDVSVAMFDTDADCSTCRAVFDVIVPGNPGRSANAHDKIAVLSEWIDSSYPEDMIGTELHTRRRVDKLMEEAGEVGQAVGGFYGENPRKGITHSRADILAELLDVAVTALGAYESLTGNSGASGPALDAKMDGLLERVGLIPSTMRPEADR